MMLTENENSKLWSLVKPLKTCMFVTTQSQALAARPMELMQSDFDGIFYFFTDKNSPKVEEFQHSPQVCLAFSCPKAETYVSISGTAALTQDAELITKFWSPAIAAWFPNGKEDPAVALIAVKVLEAEYWNITDNKLVQLFKYTSALLTKQRPQFTEHEKM